MAFVTCTYPTSGVADTSGWDTVYAIKATALNKSIADHFKTPAGEATLAFSQTMDSFAGTVSATGSFGGWQITTGGSGPNLNLSIPVLSGTMTVTNPTTKAVLNSVTLAGVVLSLQVTLGFHAVTAPPPSGVARPGAPSRTVPAALKVNANKAAPTSGSAAAISAGGSTANGKVTVLGVANCASTDPILQAMVQEILQTWLNGSEAALFEYALMAVDIADDADTGTFSWIAPTYVGYAVTDTLGANNQPASIDGTTFAFLAMTENRSSTGASPQVSVNAIPSNAGVNAAFLIAPNLVISKFLQPNLPALFQGSSANDFVVSTDGMTISNANALTLSLQLDPAWYVGGNPATATIPVGDFSLTVEDTEISQQFLNISFPYGLQNELTVNVTLGSTCSLGIDENKRFALQYGSTTTSALSVQPDAEKIAAESLESIGVNLLVTVVFCFAGFGEDGAGKGEVDPDEPGPSVKGEPPLSSEQSSLENEVEDQAAGEKGATPNNSIDVPIKNSPEVMSTEELGSDVGESGIKEIKNPSTWTFKSIMPRFTFKVWAMFAGQFVGQLYGDMSNIDQVIVYQQKPEDMPTLQNFANSCIQPTVWPQTQGATLICAGLNGALTLGLEVT